MSKFSKFGRSNFFTNIKNAKVRIKNFEIPVLTIVVVLGVVIVIGVVKFLPTTNAANDDGTTSTVADPSGTRINPYALSPLTKDQLVGNAYYVKDGDVYYALAAGYLMSTKENDSVIPEAASPTERLLMFGQDDTTIPTLYSDSQIIYKTNGATAIPTDFYLERFCDEGYSIGLHGLTEKNGKYSTTVTDTTFYPGSSISTLQIEIGGELTVDKVNGTQLTADMVSPGGTITGLQKGTAYQFDIYGGTNYNGVEAEADTHMLTSYELYDLQTYSMDQNNYLTISMPADMWSGYYYINGMGCFRYVNMPKAEASGKSVNYNVRYFLGSTNGENLINPADKGREDAVYIGEVQNLDDLKESGTYYGYLQSEDESDEEPTEESEAASTVSTVPTNEELQKGGTAASETTADETTNEYSEENTTESSETVDTEEETDPGDVGDTRTLISGSKFASHIDPTVTTILFINGSAPDGQQIEDLSLAGDSSVISWTTDGTMYVSTPDTSKKIIANVDSSNMFANSNVQIISFDALDTSNVLDMSGMFAGCSKLEKIVGLTDVSNVKNMDTMFMYCTSLEDYSFTKEWHIDNVQSFNKMCASTISQPEFTNGSWDDEGTFVKSGNGNTKTANTENSKTAE